MSPNITAIILLLASVGTFFGVIDPQYKTYQTLAESKAQYQTAAEQARAVRTVREKLVLSASNISQMEKERLSRMLPDTVDTVRLTTDITSIASKYGILIKKIDVKSEEKQMNASLFEASPFATAQQGPDYKPLPISFSLTTGYENFSSFLSDLEKSLRMIDVVSITVVPNTTGLYDFSVAAKTYSFAAHNTAVSAAATQQDAKARIVEMLGRLSVLKLDRAFFDSPLFRTLKDFSIEVVAEPKGRPNPFAPIGQ